jgi:RNA polymerase sigma factor (sigma-70 family)
MVYDPEDDQKLLSGIAAGETRAVEAIYKNILPSVIFWIRKNSGSEMQARDIFQDALIALYKRSKEEDFELTSTLKTYLMVVCKNLWLKSLRDIKRMDYKEATDMDGDSLDQGTIEKIEANDRRKLYLKYFDMLGEDCQKILAMYFEKISYKAIAKKLDSTEGYIKKRKFKCKEKLMIGIRQDVLYAELYG